MIKDTILKFNKEFLCWIGSATLPTARMYTTSISRMCGMNIQPYGLMEMKRTKNRMIEGKQEPGKGDLNR
eukprot:2135712-Prorocentrum_lima.AAC.1